MSNPERYPAIQLTPKEFELEVKSILDRLGLNLNNFASKHREVIVGLDGEYEIDVTARFSVLGVEFLVLVECKHYKNSVKREVIQNLHSKLQSAGAQKGIVFSSSGFQSGAIEFANAHGIATVQLTEGKTNYFTKSIGGNVEPPPWVKIEPIIGWLIRGNHYSIVSQSHPEYLQEFLVNENL